MITMRYNHITELIGNTPVLRIDPAVHGLKNIELYAKLENMNPFGSVKDRIAWGMLKDGIADIKRDGKTVLESSSGNTAKALTIVASVFGVPFKTITNRIKVPEVKEVLKALGAEIEELPGKSDCHDPNDPNDPIVLMNRESEHNPNGVYVTRQYENHKNIDTHYATTGEELQRDLGTVDYIFAGLGTTGSSRGAALKLKEYNPDLVAVGIIAEKRDYIPGIRNADEMFEVGLFKPEFYNDIISVTSNDAVEGALALAQRSGVLGGPTSGANFTGALRYLSTIDQDLTEKKTAVFIVCDRFESYMSYFKQRAPERFGEKARPGSFRAWKHDGTAVAGVSVAEAEGFIEREHPLVIDTRSPLAFEVARIKGSINIPQDTLESLLDGRKPFPADQAMLLVCPLGEQSAVYAAYLSSIGYTASSLEGGITAWRDHGKPLERTT